jgi:hypothetical protein
MILSVIPALLIAADQPVVDVDAEINRIRRELSQVQAERLRNRQEAEKDKQDFKKYTERTAARVAQIKIETDSIKMEISRFTAVSDSLAAQINQTQTERRQVELHQNFLGDRLIMSCDTVTAHAQRLSPMVRGEILSSLALLKSELTAQSVDNTEAASRLAQIMLQMDEITGSIQVVQEVSPLPDIRGTVYRIRYGGLFEAIVDVKGEQCAVWTEYAADGSPRWKTVADRAVATEMLKAAEVREGKALPGFVKLPLVADSDKRGGQ